MDDISTTVKEEAIETCVQTWKSTIKSGGMGFTVGVLVGLVVAFWLLNQDSAIVEGLLTFQNRVRRRWTAKQAQEVHEAGYGRCLWCTKDLGKAENRLGRWVLDHFRAFADNGRDAFENLVPSCIACNSKKGAIPPRYFCEQMLGIPLPCIARIDSGHFCLQPNCRFHPNQYDLMRL